MKLVLGTSTVGANGEIRLPPEELKKRGFKPGDGVHIWVEDGAIMMSRSFVEPTKEKKHHK